jgi:hypothetical protein
MSREYLLSETDTERKSWVCQRGATPKCQIQILPRAPLGAMRAAREGDELGVFEPSAVTMTRCDMNADCSKDGARCVGVQGNNFIVGSECASGGEVAPFCMTNKLCSNMFRFLPLKVGPEGANTELNRCASNDDCRQRGAMCIIPHDDEPDRPIDWVSCADVPPICVNNQCLFSGS